MIPFHRYLLFLLLLMSSPGMLLQAQPSAGYDLSFTELPAVWDEGFPLGNGILGAMIWQKGDKLRFSLDRADVWDLRTVKEFDLDEWNFSWVYQRWLQPKEYTMVQQLFDAPYERDAAPTRIPPGAMEFPVRDFGTVEFAHLSLKDATCEIKWKNGVKLVTYIHATDPVGFFSISGLKHEISPDLIVPQFQLPQGSQDEPRGLQRLNYPSPTITNGENSIHIHQSTYGLSSYDIYVIWKYANGTLTGLWSISVSYPGEAASTDAQKLVDQYSVEGNDKNYADHLNWWNKFWQKSAVMIPDTALQKQYYLDLYKLGCISRKGAPAASLQAIWTTDNGKLPPWKNDYHNDMNTQMTYWPCYTANHLAESYVFTEWLWNYKTVAEKYTRKYFGAEGLNFPGVSAMNAYPLGGWIQYAFSSTTSAWLSQYFYWQWKYSMDKAFLVNRAYPWVKEVGTFLENISVVLPDSTRWLLLSSSPEMFDNTEKAWFKRNTNYDVSLIRNLYTEAIEMADVLALQQDKIRWTTDLAQWRALALDEADSSLLIAKDFPLEFSHRHFSHMMAVYPLGLLDCSRSETEKTIVDNSLERISKLGTKEWCGYSFAWYAALLARAGKGGQAAEALHTFVKAFTLPNSFHVNGDQTKSGYSDNHSRIFTVEGNMAFAAALQEMLLQSYQGVIRIFPAIPETWNNASFMNLRAEGAFVVTAERSNGETNKVMVMAEKGGTLKMLNPFKAGTVAVTGTKEYSAEGKVLVISTKPGQLITFEVQ